MEVGRLVRDSIVRGSRTAWVDDGPNERPKNIMKSSTLASGTYIILYYIIAAFGLFSTTQPIPIDQRPLTFDH